MTKIEKVILFLAAVIFLAMVIHAVRVHADDGSSAPHYYAPTEIQSLRLQLRQRDAQLAQKDLFVAQQNFKVALDGLDAEATKVRTENNWPATIQFDKENLTFTEIQTNPKAPRIAPSNVPTKIVPSPAKGSQ